MAANIFTFPDSTDQSVINCFKAISRLTSFNTLAITTTAAQTIQVDISQEIADDLKFILAKKSALISRISLNIPGYTIVYDRKAGAFNTITVTHDQGRCKLNHQSRLEVNLLIVKKLKAFDPKLAPIDPNEQQAQVNAIHNSTLKRLEELNEELFVKSHDFKNQLEYEYAKKIEATETILNKKFKAKEEKLAQESKIVKDHLNEQKTVLEQQLKTLDDNNNTHARRNIRKDLLKEIKERQTKFALTDGTNKLRKPITVLMVTLITVFGFLAVLSALDLNNILRQEKIDTTKLIITSIRQLLFSAGTIGSILFMIRWMNKWFESHSQTEFSLKRFELDMERASWLVETNLEWNDKKDGTMPDILIESLSKNLFLDEKAPEQIQDPADQLASALFNHTKSVKLKVGENEAEMDTKKMNQNKDKPKTPA